MLPIILSVAVVLALGAATIHAQRKRREMLRKWAKERGWSYRPARDGSLDDRFPEFDCLRQGRSRYGYNFIRGERDGRAVLCFDYRYTTGSGKHRSTHTFSSVIVASELPLQPLTIRREHIFDKLGSFFGFDDIDFESAEFSRRYCVRAADRRWAFDVLHARTIEFLLAQPHYNLEFGPREVMAWRSDVWDPQEFEQAIGLIEGILDGFPDYLRRQIAASSG